MSYLGKIQLSFMMPGLLDVKPGTPGMASISSPHDNGSVKPLERC